MANPNPTPFQKTGADANPKGRPKKDWTWAGLLEKVGEEIEPKSGKKFKELVSKRLWIDAINGNLGAIKEILNRMDGLPVATTNLNTSGSPLVTIDIDGKNKTNRASKPATQATLGAGDTT